MEHSLKINTILSCQNLSYSIGFNKIIKNSSFEINSGEVVALAGDNGSGKSTLLKLIIKKNSSFRWNRDYLKQQELYPVSYLGHEPGLYTSLTLEENIEYFKSISVFPPKEKIIDDLLNIFRLKHRIHDPVYTFSRGMLQKAALIRTLLIPAALYLLDEPYTGLDESSAKELNRIIIELKGNSAVLLVVHDSNLISQIADRVLKLEDRIII